MGNAVIESLLQKDFRIEVNPNWSLPEMIKSVMEAVEKHIASNEELKALLKMLPRGSFTLCPNSPEEVQQKYIANRGSQIDRSDPRVVLAFMENFVSSAAALERRAIAYGATHIRDITSDELILLSDPFVALATDKLWYRWFQELVVPLEILGELEKTEREKELASLMHQYDYTVFMNGQQLTWAQAFPVEIQELEEALKRLGSQLRDRHIKKYIRILARAYSCKKREDLEKRWADVDYAWIEIPKDCRVFPEHGMEAGYEHPYAVSPEWNIMVRLDFGEKEIQEICSTALKVAHSLGADTKLLKRKLDGMDIGVFYIPIWAGFCLNFRYSGQAVPNREEVLYRGGKIFIDPDAANSSVEKHKKALRKHVSESAANVLIPHIDTLMMVESIAGHEVSHLVGCSAETDKKLGASLKLLEEAKATMCGNLINEARTEEARLKIVAETIARFCRFFSKTRLEDPTVKRYVWENTVACNTMHKAGVIKMGDNCIEVDLEKARGRAWFVELEKFVASVFRAYEGGDVDALEKIHQAFCNKDEGIVAEIIALVNK